MSTRIPGTVIALAGSAGLLLAAGTAQADMYKSGGGSLYAGANYNFMSVDGGGVDADLGMISAKVGAKVNPYLGIEARAGFGVDGDDVGGGAELELNALYGAYAKLNVDNPSPATPYLVLGLTRYELEASGPGGTYREDDSDFSYGIGVDLAINESVSGNLEYMRYGDEDDVTLDGIALGMTVHF